MKEFINHFKDILQKEIKTQEDGSISAAARNKGITDTLTGVFNSLDGIYESYLKSIESSEKEQQIESSENV